MEVTLTLLNIFILYQGIILCVFSATTTSAQCSVGQTSCDDGSCYNSVGRCDGIPDCIDGSDEANCQTNTLPPQCPEQQQRCPDGSCINPHDNCTAQTASTMAGDTVTSSITTGDTVTSSITTGDTVTSSITTGDTFTTSSVALVPPVNGTLPPWSIALIVIFIFVAVLVLVIIVIVRQLHEKQKVGNSKEDIKSGLPETF